MKSDNFRDSPLNTFPVRNGFLSEQKVKKSGSAGFLIFYTRDLDSNMLFVYSIYQEVFPMSFWARSDLNRLLCPSVRMYVSPPTRQFPRGAPIDLRRICFYSTRLLCQNLKKLLSFILWYLNICISITNHSPTGRG